MISASEISNIKFEHLKLRAPWKDIIGQPSTNSSILLYSRPGSGKSTVALQLADELTIHGTVGYVPAEEGVSPTLQNKLERTKLTNTAVKFLEADTLEDIKSRVITEHIDILFIDSFTIYDRTLRQFEEFRKWAKENDVFFVSIVQTTKEGKFYGNADAAFNVDCVLQVIDGRPSTEATGKNRLGELYEHDVDLRAYPVKPLPSSEAKRGNPYEDNLRHISQSEAHKAIIALVKEMTEDISHQQRSALKVKLADLQNKYDVITELVKQDVFKYVKNDISEGFRKFAAAYIWHYPKGWVLEDVFTLNKSGKLSKSSQADLKEIESEYGKYELMYAVFSDKEIEEHERNNPSIPITQLEGTATKNDLPHNRADNYWSGDSVKVDFPLKPWHTDPEVAKEEFQLKGIEFGNWLNAENRVAYLANTMQALHNMAKILGLPNSAMGVNYQLGIAFGARGQGGAAIAHYESTDRTMINLTKESGKDSLAHEYGHCIDNLVGEKLGIKWISGYRSTNKSLVMKGSSPIIKTINDFFKTLYFTKKGSPSAFNKRISKQTEYNRRRTEIVARCTDLYFQEQAKAAKYSTKYMAHDSFEGRNPTKKEFKLITPILKRYYKEAFEILLDSKKVGKKTEKPKPVTKAKPSSKKKKVKTASKPKTLKEFHEKLPVLWGHITIKGVPKFGQFKAKHNRYSNKTEYSYFTEKGHRGTGGFTIAKAFQLLSENKLSVDRKDWLDDLKKDRILPSKKLPKKKSTQKKQLPLFRINGSDEALIYLGAVEKIDVDSPYIKGLKGNLRMFSNQAQNKLFIIPTKYVRTASGVVDDATAEKLFSQWHNYPADHQDLEVDFPSDVEKQKIGTAQKIWYRSDKVMRPEDEKGKQHYYVHDFDQGKRPVYKQGHVMIVEKIKWNERGLLN